MARMQLFKKVAHGLMVVIMMTVLFISSGPVAAQPAVYTYANGIRLAAALPLPIYHVLTLKVDQSATFSLSQEFSNIYGRNIPLPQEDQYRGITRFTSLNETKNTLLEQFGATGGFYAYNPSHAFGNDPVKSAELDKVRAQQLACQFLISHPNLLLPAVQVLNVPGTDVLCDHNFTSDPLYPVSTEFVTGQDVTPGANQDPNQALRVLVTLPILLHAGDASKGVGDIPLGGPGGHISMIFDNTSPNADPTQSLDQSVGGLQGIAMPAFGRSFEWDRNVPAVDPVESQQVLIGLLKAAYPGATDIVVPMPALEFYVSDAGTPQTLLEPMLNFSGIHLTVDGQDITLKSMTLPAVQQGAGGVGPAVTIAAPLDGSGYLPGKPTDLQGMISDGIPPYNYDWQLDDGTSLGGGTADAAGNLPVLSKILPQPDWKGTAGTQTVHLVVTDSEGATREAEVTLYAPSYLFLPALATHTGMASILQSLPQSVSASASGPVPNSINYRFGVEYGSDYPPYGAGGPDLAGVPPDANGFSGGLMSLGYPRVFNWANSLAWERDWRDCSLGGSDCTYGVDRADFVYYSGHGSNGGIAVPSNSHDSNWADASNARFSSARWVAFSSCLTLRAQWTPASAAPIRRWFNAFQGVHMLMGFNSLMADVAYGGPLVDNMRMPSFIGIDFPWAQRTIAQAWVQTAFELNAGKPAYIWATSASVNPIGNKLPKVTDALLPRPYPANWYYWVWWDD